eukprot:324099-Heterocapsa_arctica.AAC.1
MGGEDSEGFWGVGGIPQDLRGLVLKGWSGPPVVCSAVLIPERLDPRSSAQVMAQPVSNGVSDLGFG